MLCPLLIGFGNGLNRRESEEKIAEVRCCSLSGLRARRWAPRTPSGRWGGETGFRPSHCWFCFLFFAFLLSVLFSLQFFCPFEFRVWSNDCFVHSPFSFRGGSPLRGGLCLVIGHASSCRDCFGRRAVLAGSRWESRPGFSWWDTPCVPCTGLVLLCLGEAQPHLLDVALSARTSFIFPF